MNGNVPVVFGHGVMGQAFDQQVNGISAGGMIPVMVVDEFFA